MGRELTDRRVLNAHRAWVERKKVAGRPFDLTNAISQHLENLMQTEVLKTNRSQGGLLLDARGAVVDSTGFVLDETPIGGVAGGQTSDKEGPKRVKAEERKILNAGYKCDVSASLVTAHSGGKNRRLRGKRRELPCGTTRPSDTSMQSRLHPQRVVGYVLDAKDEIVWIG